MSSVKGHQPSHPDGDTQSTHVGHRLFNCHDAIGPTLWIVRWVIPHIQTENLVLNQQAKYLSHALGSTLYMFGECHKVRDE